MPRTEAHRCSVQTLRSLYSLWLRDGFISRLLSGIATRECLPISLDLHAPIQIDVPDAGFHWQALNTYLSLAIRPKFSRPHHAELSALLPELNVDDFPGTYRLPNALQHGSASADVPRTGELGER
jgi:hypothetical protein